MGFSNLFQLPGAPVKKSRSASAPRASSGERKPKRLAVKADLRGCEYCPLNNRPGIQKIMGAVAGKSMAIFAQSPGPDENDEGVELIGRSGELLWDELEKVGITRDDVDVQNVIRCFPADEDSDSYNTRLKMRNPTAQEIKCCSLHTDAILPKLKASRILVLGVVAAKALLNSRSLPKHKIFWDERLKAKIYLATHPAYFVRGYASDAKWAEFRDLLKLFASDAAQTAAALSDPFDYLRKQDYQLVQTKEQALVAMEQLRKYAKKRRIAVDIEDADFDGTRKVVGVGFSPKKGQSFFFVFCHDEQDPGDGVKVKRQAKLLLEDVTIRKSMQYGCSDCDKLRELEGINVRGFENEGGHDTNLSEWLRFPDRKQYGLDAIAEARFPEFSGYKQITTKDTLAKLPDVPTRVKNASLSVQTKYIIDNELFDIRKLSLETLRLYNGGDCDLTGRIERSNTNEVNAALLNLYMELSYILHDMEANGPLFDYEQQEKLAVIYPKREERLLAQLRKMLGNPDYNPGSSPQVLDAVYNHFRLKYPFAKGKPNTQKLVMQSLGRVHTFPLVQIEWRGVSKAKGTYIDGYRECAETNGGRLRTIWWATGTRTGRLSSSGGKSKTRKGVNLQNIHGDPQIQNMCVSDSRWKKFYRVMGMIMERWPDPAKAGKKAVAWLRKHMPDLKTFLILDYGQVEVRVAAQISNDKNLLEDCKKSDIHTAVGVTMTGWDPEKIAHDKRVRTSTKNVHFGTLFGSGDKGTHDFVVARTPMDQEPMTLEQVSEARARYFARYTGIRAMIDSLREFGREHKYVETLFGMKQPLVVREADDEEEEVFEEAKRGAFWANQAINGPVQGTAHQLLVCALVNLRRQVEKYKVLNLPVLDVHDALYFAVDVLSLPEGYTSARYLMEKESLATVKSDFPHINWKVPIATEAEAGLSLGCKIELKEGFSIGDFLVQWYQKRKAQMDAIDAELLTLY